MVKKNLKNEPVTKEYVQDEIRISLYYIKAKQEEHDHRFDDLDKKYNTIMEHLVGLAAGFKKFDEEHAILSDHDSDHGDRIEALEKAVFKTS